MVKNKQSFRLFAVVAAGIVAAGIVAVGFVAVVWWPAAPSEPPDAVLSDGPALLTTPQARQEVAALRDRMDPAKSGWRSEAFAQAAEARLKQLAAKMAQGDVGREEMASIADENCLSWELRPLRPREVHRSRHVVVRRATFGENTEAGAVGIEALADALNALTSTILKGPEARVKLKITGVEMRPDGVETTVAYEASGRGPSGWIQQTGEWRCVWTHDAEAPRIVSLGPRRWEEVETLQSEGRWFSDCTQSVLGSTKSLQRQLSYGLDHWLRRIERSHGMLYFRRQGLAVGDVNGDGLDDVYVCQAGGLPNRLLVQQADGTVVDVSRAAGVDWLDPTSSALWVDLDNDGKQDLALATAAGVLLQSNRGDGTFERRALLTLDDTDVQALSAIDYDNDGDLDLYVTVDFASGTTRRREGLPRFLYHDANDGGINRLFRNDGGDSKGGEWVFTDVTAEVGLDVHNRRHSLAASWEDYDNDGDVDLYVANDYGQNCLYRNGRDAAGRVRFEEVAEAAGVVDYGSGMSISWADYNRDGTMDLYVGNMFSTAGSRITTQDRFLPGSAASRRALYRRFVKGNSLYRNDGPQGFREVVNSGAQMGRWAWSSLFADLDNDGWEDIVVANGYITTDDPGDL
ncbi:MAG: VCBS repeat-containing protein [Planctomycetes bacterium]|nr:VCBS repeat-containing protein [Planctomycetota bacterium]